MSKRNILLSIFAVVAILLLGNYNAWSATITSAANGNWSSTTTWTGGVVPGPNDIVQIGAHTITVDQDVTIQSLDLTVATSIINPASTGSYTITLTDDNSTGSHALRFGNAAAEFNYANGTGRLNLVFAGTMAQSVLLAANATGTVGFNVNNITFNNGTNVTIDGNFGWFLYGNMTLVGNASVTVGAYDAGKTLTVHGINSAITVPTTASLTLSNVSIAATATNVTMAGSATVSGTFTVVSGGKFNQTSGTITMTDVVGASALIIGTGTTAAAAENVSFYNLTITATGAIAPAHSFQVKGNFNKSGASNFAPSAGFVVFKNTATPNNAKTLTISGGTDSFFNLLIDDGSYVTTSSNFSITGGTFEVVGSGSFKATAGTITFSGLLANITTSTLSTCEFMNITFSIATTTYSNFTVKGNLSRTAPGLTAYAPSTITFAGGTQSITSAANDDFTFNNVIVKNGTTLGLIGDFIVNINGDLAVENGATANLNAATAAGSALTFGTISTKTITNNGTLNFSFVTVAAGIVQTSSDFTIAGTLTTTAPFIASGNSTITFNAVTPLASASQTNTIFQNVRFITTAATIPALSYRVNGDFIADAAVTHAASGEVLFGGTTEQKIKGNALPTFFQIEVSNPVGIKLERNIQVDGSANAVTFTLGNIDLNGNTLTLNNAAPVISDENSTRRFINTASNPGVVTTISIPIVDANASGIGTTGITGPTNVTVQRILAARKIGDVNSVKRYYSINPTVANLSAVTLAYFDDELNGNTEANLWPYATQNATTTTLSTFANIATNWAELNSTAPTVTVNTTTNTVTVTGADIAFGTAHFLGLRNREVKIESWPTTGVHNDLAIKAMPLVAGATTSYGDNNQSNDIILARFAVTPYFTQTGALTQITAKLNLPVNGIISNIYLIEATNLTTPTVDDIVIGTITGTTVTFTISGADQNLAALTTRYFYIAGTVTNSVNSSTQHITITVAPSDLTIANTVKTGTTQTSPTISFTGQNVSFNVNNTPLSKPVMQGSSAQAIFGFTLVPPAGTPTVNINSLKFKANLTDGALNTHFTNFVIHQDFNKDGIPDATTLNTTAGSINSGGYINISTDQNNTLTTERQYLVVCNVAPGATIGGRIQLIIESSADVVLTNPAMVVSGGPYDGGTFTVSSTAAVPTKLVITNFGLVTIPTDDSPEKKDREVISGVNLNIQIQSQDANGNPANVSVATNVNITVTSGTAAVANGTGTILIDNNLLSISNLQLTNALGYGPITITVTPTSGMTALTPATYTNILVYAQQPTTQANTLANTTPTPTTIPLTWTRGDGAGLIIVAREGNWPAKPADGVVYDQVPGSNFTATSGSGNFFTGTGSVVVYKGAGTAVTINGLTPGKTYYLAAYEYNGGATANSKPNYLLTTTSYTNELIVSTPSAAPTLATSAVTFAQVTTNSIKVDWTNGNGEKRIVVARAGAAPTPVITDGQTYTANSAYGDPTTANGDGFVVYNGNANTVTVTNLLPGTTYHFAVYEYNGSGIYTNYIATAATGNRSTLLAQPTIQAHSIDVTPVSNTSLKVTWVNGNGSGRVLLGKEDSQISNADFPLDQGAALTANAAFGLGTASGDAYVLATSSPATITGLQFGKTYYFRVFEYNGTAGVYATSTVNYLTSAALNNPNYGISDADEPANNTMATAKYYGTSNGTLVDGIISNANDVDWYSVEPNVEGGYKYLRIKLTNQPRNYTIELYDKNGRRLRSSKFTGTTDEVIVINNLPIGVYYIKVYSENGDFSITPYKVSSMESELEYKSETP